MRPNFLTSKTTNKENHSHVLSLAMEKKSFHRILVGTILNYLNNKLTRKFDEEKMFAICQILRILFYTFTVCLLLFLFGQMTL